jgi:hypothetical protein
VAETARDELRAFIRLMNEIKWDGEEGTPRSERKEEKSVQTGELVASSTYLPSRKALTVISPSQVFDMQHFPPFFVSLLPNSQPTPPLAVDWSASSIFLVSPFVPYPHSAE